jgi:Tfp pilus assembly protein PilZ
VGGSDFSQESRDSMGNASSSGAKVIAPDLFFHEPVSVSILDADPIFKLDQFQSRHITSEGMFIEVRPPMNDPSILRVNSDLKVEIMLPSLTAPIQTSGFITRIVQLAQGPDQSYFSLIGIRFHFLDSKTRELIGAHHLASQAARGQPRAVRVQVRFPVEPVGIDVVSALTACDLSMSGMFIGTRAKFSLGKKLGLTCHLPFQRESTSVNGEVVWIGEKSLPGVEFPAHGFGVHFVETTPRARANLALYYARFLVTP